ncbi:tRNA threonylcarbamoyladenosine biosynthesis protein TsaB [hydrothermal vent metagenome]|uniref:tRNA threonylcarbamoyladenosine biosynthesis protein TsaB n=1 Tax=hydrothermal vent metagenome TaxID=652676 RepID=A0A3B0VSZ8_9ZZZZ
MHTFSILAIETSTIACSVALFYQNTMYQRYELLPQKHAHQLLKMVDEVLCEAGIKGQEVDLLAYGEGPGAFTGVRIAAGVVQGLSLGWSKPVLGVSSLEAMAERVLNDFDISCAQQADIPWCALMDARMQEVYFQSGVFNLKTKQWLVSEACLLKPDEIKERIKCLPQYAIGLGDIQNIYPELSVEFVQWFDVLPSAEAVVRCVLRMDLEQIDKDEREIALPVYLRNHVADTIQERARKQLNS